MFFLFLSHSLFISILLLISSPKVCVILCLQHETDQEKKWEMIHLKKKPTIMELSLSLSLWQQFPCTYVWFSHYYIKCPYIFSPESLPTCFFLLHNFMRGYLSLVVLCPLQELLNIYQKEKRWFRPSFTKYCVISKAGIIRYILSRCQQVYTGVTGYIKVNTGVTRYPGVWESVNILGLNSSVRTLAQYARGPGLESLLRLDF